MSGSTLKIACQTCHIPARAVKSALAQVSDVYNPAPRITPPAKHIWTFYDQEMAFWNHYGELELFTGKDEPTNVTRPTLIRHKGKIYPANRVHGAWVGFEEEGQPGLNQLFMKDFFQMWTQHRADPKNRYPELASITDDNKDGVIEVNRPEEIDALLAATRAHLTATRFPLEKRRLVWVSDSRAYYSSTESRELPREGHEATAYASVYKFSHDVSPGRAALGSGGCTDCHRTGSPFFQGAVLAEAFSGNDARPRWVPNHDILGISSFWVKVGAFREERLKPVLYSLGGVPALLGLLLGLRSLAVRQGALTARVATGAAWSLLVAAIIGGLLAVSTPGLLDFMVGRRLTLDANHFWIGIAVLTAALLTSLMRPPAEAPVPRIGRFLARRLGPFFLGLSALAGALIVLKMRWLESVTRLSYTAFDLGLVLLASSAVVLLALRLAAVGEVGSHKAPE